MKKFIGILLIIILIALIVLGFKKNPVEKPPVTENPPVSNEVTNPPENNEKEDEKEPSVDVPKKENEKEDQGMFLGMDDSNFLVIFSSNEKKDVYYKIDPALKFEDSDIELGSAVKYRYTVSETDEKTITFIEAVK